VLRNSKPFKSTHAVVHFENPSPRSPDSAIERKVNARLSHDLLQGEVVKNFNLKFNQKTTNEDE